MASTLSLRHMFVLTSLNCSGRFVNGANELLIYSLMLPSFCKIVNIAVFSIWIKWANGTIRAQTLALEEFCTCRFLSPLLQSLSI